LAIAESEFSHQTLAEVSPFRDLLVSLFFISIGMLLNVGELWSDFGMAAAALIAVLAIKFLSGFVPVLLWGYPLRVATVVGLAIAQIGEFAFVLGHAGHAAGVLTDAHYQQFLLVAIATMIASPFVVASSQPAYLALARVPGLCRLDEQRLPKESEAAAELSGHVIVAGYGLNGRNLAQSLQSLGLPYVVLEMNPTTVHNARQRGEPVYFGDCSRIDVLRKLSLATARGLVLAVSDARATRQAVQAARRENPGLKIVARTRYLSEIDALRQAGADEVVSEEFETSLEVLALTLRLFDVPRSSIDRIVDRIRGDTYSVFRAPASPDNALPMLASLLPGVVFETQTIGPRAAAVGRTLSQIDLRARTGATLLAVRRQADLVTVPTADLMLQANDDVLLAGNPDQVRAAMALLESTATGSTAAVE
jgi:CPA2 family monovalent cation:H+ antiporter-2